MGVRRLFQGKAKFSRGQKHTICLKKTPEKIIYSYKSRKHNILAGQGRAIAPSCPKVGTPSVNFINALLEVYTHADPETAKKTVKLSVFIVLLGSAHAKAAHKTLMKSAPNRLSLISHFNLPRHI